MGPDMVKLYMFNMFLIVQRINSYQELMHTYVYLLLKSIVLSQCTITCNTNVAYLSTGKDDSDDADAELHLGDLPVDW